MNKKAVFFDRDGIINFRIVDEYVKCVEEFHIIPDVLGFFKKIKEQGFLAIIVTNQQGIGKKIMSDNDLAKINNYMQESFLEKTGYTFDDINYCSDLKETNSFRRKPNPGMLLEAIGKWNIDPSKSYMIGDTKSDIIAGQNAGLKTILIGNSKITNIKPDYYYLNFDQLSIYLG
jgi:D-glycero-D-manno-heptose 1,7-bisphosphate phosphatase